MTDAELKEIIQAADGKCWALEHADTLLKKINRLEEAGQSFTQFRSAKEPGDFRGRVLEVNFADLFVQKGIKLQYETKQGMSGDIDFCWRVNGDRVFIEMKLLGQDKSTKESVAKQLEEHGKYGGCFTTRVSDDTKDVVRIQRDIFLKSSIKKFKPQPAASWVNLVAIDLSELQLGTVDIGDCLLATGGNELVAKYCHYLFQRPAVVGVFETEGKQYTAEQAKWVTDIHKIQNAAHSRDYIHGVLFLFREPTERAALSYELSGVVVWNLALRAALSYELSGVVVWNLALIRDSRAEQILKAFHQIVPRTKFSKSC